ncbi:MAG TPA: hypothetical protein VFV38_41075 [Ktedonobacteraceae bacterium]|nr:hypothetical protein [Ktedonobacteraceae bacterium]
MQSFLPPWESGSGLFGLLLGIAAFVSQEASHHSSAPPSQKPSRASFRQSIG